MLTSWRILTFWCWLIRPVKHFMWVSSIILVVRDQFEAFSSEGTAEVPLPDWGISLSPAITTHLRPGLQEGDIYIYVYIYLMTFYDNATDVWISCCFWMQVTLKMRMSVSEESCLKACFHGTENSVRSRFVHWTPGYLVLSMWARSQGMSRGLEWDIPAGAKKKKVTSTVSDHLWLKIYIYISCLVALSIQSSLPWIQQWNRNNCWWFTLCK